MLWKWLRHYLLNSSKKALPNRRSHFLLLPPNPLKPSSMCRFQHFVQWMRQQSWVRSYSSPLRALFIRLRTYPAMITEFTTPQGPKKFWPSNSRQGSTNIYFLGPCKNRTLCKCRSLGHFAYTLHLDRHHCAGQISNCCDCLTSVKTNFLFPQFQFPDASVIFENYYYYFIYTNISQLFKISFN